MLSFEILVCLSVGILRPGSMRYHVLCVRQAKSSFETATAVADYKAEAAKALHAQAKVRAASADRMWPLCDPTSSLSHPLHTFLYAEKMALVRETAEALAKERREKRVKSVLSLKANVDAATSEIKVTVTITLNTPC